MDRNSIFYSSGRATIFKGPSPRQDEDPFFAGNERVEEGKKLPTKIFNWKSFVVTNQSAKTVKLFHLE